MEEKLDLEGIMEWAKTHPDIKRGRWVNLKEAALLQEKIAGTEIYFESGTANGFSALVASEVVRQVHTFDPINRLKIWELRKDVPKELRKRICFHQEKFEESQSLIKFSVGLKKSFFIDGDHGYLHVIRDFNTIEPYLNKGDIVVFHDLKNGPVMRAWDAIRESRNFYSEQKIRTARKMGVLVV